MILKTELLFFFSAHQILASTDYPLIRRVLMGPLEEDSQIYIYEKGEAEEISEEVRHKFNSFG